MGTIGDWGSGSTPQRGNPAYYGGDILWLKTGELNNGIVYDSEEKITDKALQECSLRLNKIGDVLILIAAPAPSLTVRWLGLPVAGQGVTSSAIE